MTTVHEFTQPLRTNRMWQGQFLKRSLTGLNLDIPSTKSIAIPQLKNPD